MILKDTARKHFPFLDELKVQWLPKDGPNVKGSGYGGHGYGGDNLYLVRDEWCWSPPFYMVRANTIEEALEAYGTVFGLTDVGDEEYDAIVCTAQGFTKVWYPEPMHIVALTHN